MAAVEDAGRGGERPEDTGEAAADDAAEAAEAAEAEAGDRLVEEEAGLGVVAIPPTSDEADGG